MLWLARFRYLLVAVVVALPYETANAEAAVPANGEEDGKEPLVLKAQGSFFVGGVTKHTDAPGGKADSSLNHDITSCLQTIRKSLTRSVFFITHRINYSQ